MRSNHELDQAVEYCSDNGIEFWGINGNPEQHTWTESPKAYCHIYIDDAAFGCPLTTTFDGSKVVDWSIVGPAVEEQLLLGKPKQTIEEDEEEKQPQPGTISAPLGWAELSAEISKRYSKPLDPLKFTCELEYNGVDDPKIINITADTLDKKETIEIELTNDPTDVLDALQDTIREKEPDFIIDNLEHTYTFKFDGEINYAPYTTLDETSIDTEFKFTNITYSLTNKS